MRSSTGSRDADRAETGNEAEAGNCGRDDRGEEWDLDASDERGVADRIIDSGDFVALHGDGARLCPTNMRTGRKPDADAADEERNRGGAERPGDSMG